MNPVWHALRLTVEAAVWFVFLAGGVAIAVYAMQNWLRVRLFR